jgi:hypothetical protein
MKRPALTSIAVVALAVSAIIAFRANTPETIDAQPVATENTAVGYKVEIDPVTGDFAEPAVIPEPSSYPVELQEALSTSTEGLEVVDAPGGGKMVDLQGRFQHTFVATVGEDGNVTAECDLPHANSEEE